mgnify:CR=1 FL=1
MIVSQKPGYGVASALASAARMFISPSIVMQRSAAMPCSRANARASRSRNRYGSLENSTRSAVAGGVDLDQGRGIIAHRVERVADQIDDDLFEPVGVAQGEQRLFEKARLDARMARRHALFKQRDGVADDLAEIDGIQLAARLACESLELAGDLPHAVDELADAFEVGACRRLVAAFEEAGNPFDPETGRRFLQEIIAAGGARPALENFRAFRGRDPEVDALLRHSGMIPA